MLISEVNPKVKMELGDKRQKLLYRATKMRCGDKQSDLYLNSTVVSKCDVVFGKP